ncbi:hypothetical protein DJ568_16455 [Mucilaginibacter hurinus]|uniref:Uncharacterized protein n=1 Tax=Mucilaginibacter hurinus TaxID=2201324 RepID=A0A367GJH7_9SPHI|nr:hypothetical protein DJ568_16455 [Mucilaginibacter hurinus]
MGGQFATESPGQLLRIIQSSGYILYQHKTKTNVYAMSLVTPDFRSNFTNKDRTEYCYLTTELLLQDHEIPKNNRFPPSPFDTTVYQFSGDKAKFVIAIESKVKNGDLIDFTGFYPTIDVIETIAIV